jgi:Protein of unknown function (DUF2752)
VLSVSPPTDPAGLPRLAASPRGALCVAGVAAAAALLVERNVTATAGVLAGPWCPLRRLTGIPCPFCGSTTSFAALGSLDPIGVVRAQPLVAACLLMVLIAAVLPARSWLIVRARVSLAWAGSGAVARTVAVAGVIAASWAYQLVRFDVIG